MKRLLAILLLPMCALAQPTSNVFTEINVGTAITLNGSRQTSWPAGGSGIATSSGKGTNTSLIGTTTLDGYPANFAKPTSLVVYGDSITAEPPTGATHSWNFYLASNLFTISNLQLVNYAQSSYQLSDVSNSFYGIYNGGARYFTNWSPALTGINGALGIMVGINDIMFTTVVTNDWIAGYTNMLWLAHQTNYNPVIAFTIQDCTTLSGPQQTIRAELNDLIRKEAAKNTSWMVLIDNDITLPSTNDTYYLYTGGAVGNGLHPTDYGQEQIGRSVWSSWSRSFNANQEVYSANRIHSAGGFVGDGFYLKNINASNLTGTVPATQIPVNTIVAAGTGIASVSSNTTSGVTTYTVNAATAAAASSFFSKFCWGWASATGSGSTIASFGNTPATSSAGTGAAVSGASATTTAPKYLTLASGTATNGYTVVYGNNALIRPDKPCKLVWRAKLSSTNGVQVYLGLCQFPTSMITDNNYGATRKNAWIQYISQQGQFWQLLTSTGGSATNVVGSIIADTSDHTFEMDYTSTSVIGMIDGTPFATNTLSLPSGAAFLENAGIGNITNAASATLSVAQFYGEQDF